MPFRRHEWRARSLHWPTALTLPCFLERANRLSDAPAPVGALFDRQTAELLRRLRAPVAGRRTLLAAAPRRDAPRNGHFHFHLPPGLRCASARVGDTLSCMPNPADAQHASAVAPLRLWTPGCLFGTLHDRSFVAREEYVGEQEQCRCQTAFAGAEQQSRWAALAASAPARTDLRVRLHVEHDTRR